MSGITCPSCAAESEPGQWACSACGVSFAFAYDHGLRPDHCPVCGSAVQRGSAQLRLSGGGPLGTLLDAGLTWSFLAVSTATCVRCGHIDLYVG